MGTTANFTKLRSSGTPKVGEWNINYAQTLDLAKRGGKWLICCWSNGDKCGNCVTLEKIFMTTEFKDWLKKQDAYFVFQYSGDKDKGKVVHDLIYKETDLKLYPGLRIQLFDKSGKVVRDYSIDGNHLRGGKSGVNGAKIVTKFFDEVFSETEKSLNGTKTKTMVKELPFKIRFNEKLTVKKVNAILDAIANNDGYCPCQAGQTDETKCHCKDFIENKKIGEPCICKIFVKQPVKAKK